MFFIKRSWISIVITILLVGCVSKAEVTHWSDMPLVRTENNPVIYADMPGLEDELGENINGPSVIKVPSWIKDPLGKYYMYFAHHRGQYIRLAYADDPEGPWKIYEPGVLKLEETVCIKHIASPNVIIEEGSKSIRMYFHGPSPTQNGQQSFIATSLDGLNFKASDVQLGLPYFSVFRYDGYYYAIGKRRDETGVLYRSKDGITPFEEGPSIIPKIRHSSLAVDGDYLYIYYSRIGDRPERILMSVAKLDKDSWLNWRASEPKEVIRPETTYEGADLPISTSKIGPVDRRIHELRDPGLFLDERGNYLYYSIAGESGIAVAKFDDK